MTPHALIEKWKSDYTLIRDTKNWYLVKPEELIADITAATTRCEEMEKALKILAVLGGGRSESNCIAQEALNAQAQEKENNEN